MGALLPLVGKAPAVANPAEKAVLGSSLENLLDDQHFGHHLFATRGVFWNIIR